MAGSASPVTADQFFGAPAAPVRTPAPAAKPSADQFFSAPAAKPSADQFFSAPAATPSITKSPKPAASGWSPDLVLQHAGPGRITSTKRSAANNARVGGSKTSSHLSGHGIDYVPDDGDFARAARALADAGVPYDQIINEGDHIHVGYGPKLRGQLKLGGVKSAPAVTAAQFFGNIAGAPGTATADRRREGGARFARGVQSTLGAGGDRSLEGVGDLVGGATEWLFSPISGPAVDSIGRGLEKAGVLQDRRSIGDISDTLLGFAGPGAKTPKPGRSSSVTPVATREIAEAPSADEFFGSAKAAAARGAATAKPTADEFFTAGPTLAAKTEDPFDDILFAPGGKTPRTPRAAPEPVAPKTGLIGTLESVASKGAVKGVKNFGAGFQKTLAPATVGNAPEAARTLRRASSEADLLMAQTWTRLARDADDVHFLPVPEQRALVSYIEGRSLGAQLANPKLQRAADDIRDTMQGYRRRIEDVFANDLDSADGPSFVRDYYSHMWKEAPDFVEGRMAVTRQGSGRNLKARSIPTLEEGIASGLTPKYENPVEATMVYAGNMSRFLATVDAQSDLINRGRALWAGPGGQPEGWVPLAGIRTTKPGRTIIQDGETVAVKPGRQLYADPNVARVYNNWISKGFEAGDFGKPFEVARRVKNASVGLSLGLSAWQATDVAIQSVLSEVARGVQSGSRVPGLAAKGRLGDAAAEAANAALSLPRAAVAPIRGVIDGGKGKRALVTDNLDSLPPREARALRAYVSAGGRVRQDAMHKVQGTGAHSFYNAITDGALKSELDKTVKRIAGPDRLLSERASSVADTALSALQSTMDPIFSTYIPRMKIAAFKSSMDDWLRLNPNAADDAVDVAAYEIMRSIDNRMGDMAWDNLFWNQQLKQSLNLLFLSPKYTVGMINEYVGGLLDAAGPSAKGLASGEGVTPRTAYVIASLATLPVLNAAYQYIKTGAPPEGMDAVAPKTGGTYTSRGTGTVPERAQFPGYGKDVYTATFDAPNGWDDWVSGKFSGPAKVAGGLVTNKDWRDDPIRDANADLGTQAQQALAYAATQAFAPYWVQEQVKGRKAGSNISSAESFFGVAPAPQSMQDRDRTMASRRRFRDRDWKRKEKTAARDKASRE